MAMRGRTLLLECWLSWPIHYYIWGITDFSSWKLLQGGAQGRKLYFRLPRSVVRCAAAYSAASTRVLSAKYDSGLRTASLRFPHFPALPCGRENCFSPSGSSFFRGGGFFSSAGRVGGLSFCPRRFPFRRKSSAADAVFPGVFEFSYKK